SGLRVARPVSCLARNRGLRLGRPGPIQTVVGDFVTCGGPDETVYSNASSFDGPSRRSYRTSSRLRRLPAVCGYLRSGPCREVSFSRLHLMMMMMGYGPPSLPLLSLRHSLA